MNAPLSEGTVFSIALKTGNLRTASQGVSWSFTKAELLEFARLILEAGKP